MSYKGSDSGSGSLASDIDYDWTGKILKEKYILVKRIGYGAFSSVWLSFDKDMRFYAVKINNCEDYKDGIKESRILMNLRNNNSENTIRIIEAFDIKNYRQEYEDESEDSEYEDLHHCIVLELMGCSCYDLLKSMRNKGGLTLELSKKIIRSVLLGLEDLNKLGYVHTDIKPDNILMSGENIRFKGLIDYIRKNYNNLLKETKMRLLDRKNKVKINYKNLQIESVEKTIKELLILFDKENKKNKRDVDSIESTETSYSVLSEGYDSDSEIYRFNKLYLNVNENMNENMNENINEKKRESKELSDKELKEKDLSNKKERNNEVDYINLENLDNIKFKLSDFGTCNKISKISKSIQTRYYRAPEVILKLELNEKCDIWSIGCTFYELLYGELLFDPDDKTELGIDKYHLYYMQSKLGLIEKDIIDLSPIKDIFFRNNYLMKGIKSLNINLIYDKILNDYNSNNEGDKICMFLYKCLNYDIKKRGNINELLKLIY